ncbi:MULTISPECIES: VUT family protein [Chromobacterium]|uniref:VUT family protein n=1 Tax=Chromobacterium aquaticum TaxID=467180 RepID=A0ABV8ZPN3_9NEIS|nr:VUT family protein [Chromobacterium sp. LK1]MCD5364459.1 VUT family protein [Chromobacterium aquaticum]
MEQFRVYGLIVGLSVTIMVVCDSLVYKTLDIHGLKITASGIVFSLCYLLSTVSTEVYGYKLGGRTVWILVACQTFFVLIINAFALLQPDNNEISKQYYLLFNEFWRVMVGTWISVPASYFCNGFVVSRMKVFFAGRLFFVRYVIASMLAQAVLLMTAYPISLSSRYSGQELVNIIATTWSYKVLVSIILLPVGYYLVGVVKRIEKTDYFDWSVSYNPLTVFKDDDEAVKRNHYAMEEAHESRANI